jgi:hypothetical protein
LEPINVDSRPCRHRQSFLGLAMASGRPLPPWNRLELCLRRCPHVTSLRSIFTQRLLSDRPRRLTILHCGVSCPGGPLTLGFTEKRATRGCDSRIVCS